MAFSIDKHLTWFLKIIKNNSEMNTFMYMSLHVQLFHENKFLLWA